VHKKRYIVGLFTMHRSAGHERTSTLNSGLGPQPSPPSQLGAYVGPYTVPSHFGIRPLKGGSIASCIMIFWEQFEWSLSLKYHEKFSLDILNNKRSNALYKGQQRKDDPLQFASHNDQPMRWHSIDSPFTIAKMFLRKATQMIYALSYCGCGGCCRGPHCGCCPFILAWIFFSLLWIYLISSQDLMVFKKSNRHNMEKVWKILKICQIFIHGFKWVVTKKRKGCFKFFFSQI